MAHVYKLVGKAGRQDLDYVPSLIGIKFQQTDPTPDDMYFEQLELPDLDFGDVYDSFTVTFSQWIAYDEVSQDGRDPILAVKAGYLSFYCPASELKEQLAEGGHVNLTEVVERLLTGRRS